MTTSKRAAALAAALLAMTAPAWAQSPAPVTPQPTSPPTAEPAASPPTSPPQPAGTEALIRGPRVVNGGRHGLTQRDLAMMDRVSDPQVSPDGRTVAYVLRSTVDYEKDRTASAIWITAADGSAQPRRLAVSDGGATTPRWSADGRSLYFLSSRGGSSQVWRTDVEGVSAVQVTTLPGDAGGIMVAPNGRALVVAAQVFVDCDQARMLACTRDRLAARTAEPSTITVYRTLPVREFDAWNDGRRAHLFGVPLNGSGLAGGDAVDLMPGFDGDAPTGDDGVAIHRDGWLIFAAQRAPEAGQPPEGLSTNSDLWMTSLPVAAAAPPAIRAVTPAAVPSGPGGEGSPALSPDGETLAWLALPRSGVSGDRPAIMVADVANPLRPGPAREIAADWDRSANAISWSADGRSLIAVAADHAQVRLFSIDVRSGDVRPLTGDGTVSAWGVAQERIVYLRDDATGPAQLYAIAAAGGPERRLTNHNAALLATIEMGAYEPFTFAGWNGEEVQGYVYKPAGYAPGRRYPVAYLIHGGPKVPFTNTFGYRWNPQVYAGAGYGVVWINFHGSPGYSQAFTDSINSHWGDRPLEDLQKGWAAALAANAWLDGDRACALGASYGGYMINWMASQWNGPWRCLVNHAGVFDVAQLMGAMDIGWFGSEFGGQPWETPETYATFEPGTRADQWTKPMLVIHGGRDFRVPLEQGLRTFHALQARGVPSRFVYAPDENHWVLKPRNSVRWQEEILGWLDEWTGAEASQ